MHPMLIEGPEASDSSQEDKEPTVTSNSHEDSITSQPTTGVLFLGMIVLSLCFLYCDATISSSSIANHLAILGPRFAEFAGMRKGISV